MAVSLDNREISELLIHQHNFDKDKLKIFTIPANYPSMLAGL
ncbi:hypothetical protein PBAL39_04069 [Pedobacter sp. BAL39]|nr:hypothetical protein PBAL39_04069 [Pedobacter sp. BAL39]